MTVSIFFHEQVTVRGEIGLVDRGQLRTGLDRIRANPDCGKPLRPPLLGCRSIRIGGSENRLVYEVIRRAGDDPIIHVLSIERRRDGEAYELAGDRR